MKEADYINVKDDERLKQAKDILRDVNLFDHPKLKKKLQEAHRNINAIRRELREHIDIDA